ncbi:hypothetical protein [Chitinophaga sp. OAE865]|uniref:hypothetical protein n=1 Tax=Chitinophaga sp. OAE865 TaxID=2817898 RepID=UPI001AE17618
MPKIVLALYTTLCLAACGDTCMKFVNTELRPQSFHFAMKEKHIEQVKVKVMSGKSKAGQEEMFKVIGFRDLYEAAEVGDTISKIAGETFVHLIKRDTTLAFKCYCNGEVVY